MCAIGIRRNTFCGENDTHSISNTELDPKMQNSIVEDIKHLNAIYITLYIEKKNIKNNKTGKDSE